jgi:hypothetical protein
MSPVEELEIPTLKSEHPDTRDLKYMVPTVDPADRRFWPNPRGSALWLTNGRMLYPMNHGRLWLSALYGLPGESCSGDIHFGFELIEMPAWSQS